MKKVSKHFGFISIFMLSISSFSCDNDSKNKLSDQDTIKPTERHNDSIDPSIKQTLDEFVKKNDWPE